MADPIKWRGHEIAPLENDAGWYLSEPEFEIYLSHYGGRFLADIRIAGARSGVCGRDTAQEALDTALQSLAEKINEMAECVLALGSEEP